MSSDAAAQPAASVLEEVHANGNGTLPIENGVNGLSKLVKSSSSSHYRSHSFTSGDLSGRLATRSLGVPKRTPELAQQLEEQILEWGGDKPIHSVLVANNGLAAVKFIRSVRSWAYKNFSNERAVNLIAMATPEDMRADAEHIRMADQFVEVPGGKNLNNYANVQLITSVAVRTGVDAVWPGWGHASEKPELPDALAETPTGIRFVGPPASAMAALGDKIGSTILAQSAGVPTLPWSGDGVTVDYASCPGGVIPEDTYYKACVHSMEEALDCCERIGYPAMLKASWGGGGKGIRKVLNDDDVRLVFKQVQGEVPGSPIFVMKLAPLSRHLEVQLLCDMHGNVCSLFSRDCSVQRRHQKIVEEGPVTAAPKEVLNHMEACARALARSVGYVGAATVEFLYALEKQEYYFLELNPRLQVEHPVTEWISNVNIPAVQLLIACGLPLHRIADIRRLYGRDPTGTDVIDFEQDERLPPAGHVVAVRITAENANDGFKPTCGSVDEISFRSTPEVWGYFSVKGGGAIHEFSDSQFGHLFAKAETREAAIRSMVVALKEIKIRGEIRNNADYVVDMIQSPDFVGDKHSTSWLDARISAQIRSERPPWHLSVICGTLLRAVNTVNSRSAEYLSYLQKGQLPPARISLITLEEELVLDGFKYRVRAVRRGPQHFELQLGKTRVEAVVRSLKDGGLLVQVDGSSNVVYHEEEAMGTRLTIGSQTCLLSKEHDPSKMLAISTGKLVRYLVADGAHIKADQPYAEIEVMKMMMTLLAPAAGLVHFQLPEGSMLAPGQLIAKLELDDPAAVRKAAPFTGHFPELGPPQVHSDSVGPRFRLALEAAKNMLAGYNNDPQRVVDDLLDTLDDPGLAVEQWEEQYGIVQSRLPPSLAAQLEAIVAEHANEVCASREREEGVAPPFCAQRLIEVMTAAIECSSGSDRTNLSGLLEALLETVRAHARGPEGFARTVAGQLLEEFLNAEEKFETGGRSTEQEVIDALRQVHANNLQAVLDIVLAHQALALKSELLQQIMSALVLPAPNHYRPQLRRLAGLSEPGAAEVAQRAQQMLEHSLLGELRSVVARALSGLDMFAEGVLKEISVAESPVRALSPLSPHSQARISHRTTIREGLFSGLNSLNEAVGSSHLLGSASLDARMAMLVEAPAAVEDALASLLDHHDPVVQRRALTTYIKRIYYSFLLHEPDVHAVDKALIAVWANDDPQLAGTVLRRECHGGAVVVRCLAEVPAVLTELLHIRSHTGMTGLSSGCLHIVLTGEGEDALTLSPDAVDLVRTITIDSYVPSDCEDGRRSVDPRAVARAAAAQVRALATRLVDAGFGWVCVMSKRGKLAPLRTAFHWAELARQFVLDPVLGLVEPPVAATLELAKLDGFGKVSNMPSRNRQWQLYSVMERKDARSLALKRVFLRGVVRQLGRPSLLAASYSGNAAAAASAAMEEIEETLVGMLEELNRIGTGTGRDGGTKPDWSHIFISVLSTLPLHIQRDETKVAAALRAAAAVLTLRHGAALRKAAVAQWEVKLRVPDKSGAWRVMVSAPTGHEAGEECVDVYREELNAAGNVMVLVSKHVTGEAHLHLHGQPVLAPYPRLEPLQQKRLSARRHKTTYCYDFAAVFENALREIWAARAAAGEPGAVPPPGKLVEAQELVPADPSRPLTYRCSCPLALVSRPVSENTVGVVAWVLTLKTPECPQGRQVVAIANDITYNSGAFGPGEDAMFRAATEYALEEKVPVVFLAANSGARVGLATEVKQCLKVEWLNPSDPTKGFKYLYLSPDDYAAIAAQAGSDAPALKASRVLAEGGEERFVISDVVGLEDGLGVECLSGSGAIAGTYTRAFREGFTITLVSGRTVGIGAYLARLGRRCVQRADQPIILTGYAALNKLLGREVYTSHMQLGGPKVMGANGVSHHVVEDDLAGVLCVLKWLSFTSPRIGEPAAALPTSDPIDRPIGYVPAEGEKLDPRAAIAGKESLVLRGSRMDPIWQSGLFDRGSWVEAQAGWARTVVTGRGRLGGMPVGVIAVEVNTVMLNLPADPGMPDSSERIIPQAGQVWFPDSALKTAQAMEEFDLEGLPLFVLANWRGFSGGQRDLFEGVLQAGSLIVDNLRTYRQPVMVYLPPGCELRGGAWVVVDSQINSNMVEMYADDSAQGGVLEPQGVVEIKFRHPDLIATMHRIDPVILKLKAERSPGSDAAIKARERQLLPVYHQVAVQFAQMHDGPVRMLSKGVLRGIVPWQQARAFFVARLRRRLTEEALLKHIAAADGSVGRKESQALLRSWYLSSSPVGSTAAAAAASGARSPSHHHHHTPRKAHLSPASSGGLGAQGGGGIQLAGPGGAGGEAGAAAAEEERLWRDDQAFMEWVEGGSGAARITMELKALRMRAAARAVQELSSTAEGTEGLVRGLQAAIKENPSLMLSLRSLLKTG